MTSKGITPFISGESRGIGLAWLLVRRATAQMARSPVAWPTPPMRSTRPSRACTDRSFTDEEARPTAFGGHRSAIEPIPRSECLARSVQRESPALEV